VSEPSVDQRRDFFDQLYESAAAGGDAVPWDREGAPQQLLAEWATSPAGPAGGPRWRAEFRRAVVPWPAPWSRRLPAASDRPLTERGSG
jgi:hypothetical protein